MTDTFEGEDLMGWLIPQDKASLFEKEWKSWKISKKWQSFFVFATWSNPTNLSIKFEQY